MPDLAGQRTIKRFRVAREGVTVDGREITRQQIIDMANDYDPVEYTARINVEHMGGWNFLGNTAIPALGDVIAVDAQLDTYKVDGKDVQLMGLYATLSALPQLVEANKQGQKLFTSIEFYPKFTATGRAYLVGLAVTDIPASRGTEPLKFSNTSQNSLFSEPQELTLMTTQTNQSQTTTEGQSPTEQAPVPTTTPQPPAENHSKTEDGFLQKMANLFNKKSDGMSQAEQNMVLETFGKINEKVDANTTANAQLLEKFTTLSEQVGQIAQNFANLQTQLSTEPVPPTTIPPVGAGFNQIDC